jgi:hypothetical protein
LVFRSVHHHPAQHENSPPDSGGAGAEATGVVTAAELADTFNQSSRNPQPLQPRRTQPSTFNSLKQNPHTLAN